MFVAGQLFAVRLFDVGSFDRVLFVVPLVVVGLCLLVVVEPLAVVGLFLLVDVELCFAPSLSLDLSLGLGLGFGFDLSFCSVGLV